MLSDPTRLSGIYVLHFSNTPYYYGGRAKHFSARWSRHRRDLQKGVHSNRHLQSVFNKYGTFTPEIVQVVSEGFDIRVMEQLWLDANFGTPWCMNQNPFAHGGNGPHTEEAKDKLRGRRHSEDQKRRWSEMRKGQKRSPDSIAQGAAAHVGKPLTEEHKNQISVAQRGRVLTDEHKAKLAAAWARRKLTGVETRNQLRKYDFDIKDVVAYLDAGGTLRGADRKFMGGGGNGRDTLKKRLVAIGEWPR